MSADPGVRCLRAAIVGLGSWGRTLVDAVQGKSELLRFTCAVSRSPASIAGYCAARGITSAESLQTVLRDAMIDAVVFATPNSQHRAQVEQAAEAGKHVFVEKPFTLNAADAESAIGAAVRAGVKLAVGFNRRFHPLMQELKQRARDGRLGVLATVLADLTATTGFYRRSDSWRVNPAEEPAGALAGIGVHLIDAMIEIVGRVREVYCVAERRAGPHGEDTSHLMLRFETGMTGSIFCSVAAARYSRFAIYGSKAFAELAQPSMETLRVVRVIEGRASHLATLPEPEIIEVRGFNTVHAQFEAFARAIIDDTPYPVGLPDVLHGVQVFEAAVKSARSGAPVRVG
jgi:predicted dehydrogenase